MTYHWWRYHIAGVISGPWVNPLCSLGLMVDKETKNKKIPNQNIGLCNTNTLFIWEKVNFRSQILVHPSIGEYWNTFDVPVLPENVIFTFFRMCWCYSEAYNTGTQKWFSIVQCSCTSIWDLKYTFSLIWSTLRKINSSVVFKTSRVQISNNCE